MAQDDDLRKELAELEKRDPAIYTRDNLKDARKLFAQALETPGGLRIETIHAFCARILRRFPLEAAVSPGFVEIEDRDAQLLWQDSVRGAILKAARAYPDALDIMSDAGGGLGAGAILGELRGRGERLLEFAGDWTIDAEDIRGRLIAALGAPADSPDALIEKAMSADLPTRQLRACLAEIRDNSKAKKTDLTTADALEIAVFSERRQDGAPPIPLPLPSRTIR